jgi:hypothetical protein
MLRDAEKHHQRYPRRRRIGDREGDGKNESVGKGACDLRSIRKGAAANRAKNRPEKTP